MKSRKREFDRSSAGEIRRKWERAVERMDEDERAVENWLIGVKDVNPEWYDCPWPEHNLSAGLVVCICFGYQTGFRDALKGRKPRRKKSNNWVEGSPQYIGYMYGHQEGRIARRKQTEIAS